MSYINEHEAVTRFNFDDTVERLINKPDKLERSLMIRLGGMIVAGFIILTILGFCY